MWIYVQRTGNLYDKHGELTGTGYSGHDVGKNNPADQGTANLGPVPQGDYYIGGPFDSPTHGPYCLRLTPAPTTNTLGRSGFLMHGDSIKHPGMASEGCIIMPRPVRE